MTSYNEQTAHPQVIGTECGQNGEQADMSYVILPVNADYKSRKI